MNEQHRTIKNFKNDATIYFMRAVIVGIGGLVTLKMYSTYFTPEKFGLYSLIYGIVGLVISIFIGWLEQSSLRFYDEYLNEKKEKQLITTIILAIFIISGFFAVLSILTINILLSQNVQSEAIYLFALGCLIFFPQSVVSVLTSLLRAQRKVTIITFGDIIITVLKIFLVWILYQVFNLDIESIFYSLLISYITISVFYIKKVKLISNFEFSSYSFDIFKKLLRYGFPLVGLSLTVWLTASSDRYFIGYFQSSYEVGIYSIGYSLANSIFTLLSAFIISAAYPLILKSWNLDGRKKTEQLVSNIVFYYFALTIPILFGSVILANELIVTFTSSQYFESSFVFQICAIGIVIAGIGQYTNKAWELNNKPHVILYFSLISAILNVILNIVFIPYFGYIAAAYTTIVSYLISIILSIFLSRRLFVVNIFNRRMLNILLSSLIMTALVIPMNEMIASEILSLISCTIFGSLIYFLSLVIFKEIDIKSLKFLNFNDKERINK